MAIYKLNSTAKEGLIKIHHYGIERFGLRKGDKYFNEFFIFLKKLPKILFRLNL